MAAAGRCRHANAGQRGAALLVALILLVVITLVGLAAIGTTILQNKAAANQYDRQVAFQAAEAAVVQAQIAITTTASPSSPAAGFEDCSTPYGSTTPNTVCLANPFTDPNTPGADKVTLPQGTGQGQFDGGGLAAAQPQYVIQYLGCFIAPTPPAQQISGPTVYGGAQNGPNAYEYYYRITARSGDPALVGERSVVTLQSTFRSSTPCSSS